MGDLRFRDSKNESTCPPHQASRIEPYEDPHLEGKAKEVYEDSVWLRYSVFIDPDVRGKSRRGNVVPRLYLRTVLNPALFQPYIQSAGLFGAERRGF